MSTATAVSHNGSAWRATLSRPRRDRTVAAAARVGVLFLASMDAADATSPTLAKQITS